MYLTVIPVAFDYLATISPVWLDEKMNFYIKNNSSSNNSVQHKYSFDVKTVLLQAVQFSISTLELSKKIIFQGIQLSQTVLIQKIQFSISTQFSSI